jgi:hypothetical protein
MIANNFAARNSQWRDRRYIKPPRLSRSGYIYFAANFFAMVLRQVEQTLADLPSILISCRFGFWRLGTFTLEWLTLLARVAFLPHKLQDLLIMFDY